MLRYLKYTFPAAGVDDIALVKPDNAVTPANTNYLLNGALARNNAVNFIALGYCRQVSITALGHDYSGVNFTIIGKQNGVSITEVLTGPDADTVYSANNFDSIESVRANADTINVSVGTGLTGYFRLIKINNLRKNVQYSLSLESNVSVNQIPTAVYTTVDNIENNRLTFDQIRTTTEILYTVKPSTSDTLYSVQYPYTSSLSIPNSDPPIPLLTNYYLVALDGDGATENSAMTLIFTQV